MAQYTHQLGDLHPPRMNPLRQTLECPVCFLVRRGDIYQCKMGHSVRLPSPLITKINLNLSTKAV